LIPGEVDTPIMDNRPIPPTSNDRTTMVGIDECADALMMMAGMPQRSNISELIIRPTMQRPALETADFP
jgi:NADP-dependent 3-hydroxy acid dehydrogenase YdfG